MTCQENEPEKNDMSVAELQDRLGTAPLTQMVTGSVTGPPEYDTDLANDTQCVTRGEYVPYENDCERVDRLGKAPKTQIVNGDKASTIGLGTATPIPSQSLAKGEAVANKQIELEQDGMLCEGVGTSMTNMDMGVVRGEINYCLWAQT